MIWYTQCFVFLLMQTQWGIISMLYFLAAYFQYCNLLLHPLLAQSDPAPLRHTTEWAWFWRQMTGIDCSVPEHPFSTWCNTLGGHAAQEVFQGSQELHATPAETNLLWQTFANFFFLIGKQEIGRMWLSSGQMHDIDGTVIKFLWIIQPWRRH